MTFIKEDDDDDDDEANSSVTNMRSKPNLAYARVKIRDVSRLNSQICHGDKINGMYSGEKKKVFGNSTHFLYFAFMLPFVQYMHCFVRFTNLFF